MYVAKPCKSDNAFEIMPEKQMKIDTEKVAEAATKIGYEILIKTPHVCILKKGREVSIFASGRVIVKETKEEDEATKIAEELHKLM